MNTGVSTFDAENFLGSVATQAAMETEYSLVPAGEYTGLIDKLEVREFPSRSEEGTMFRRLDVTWRVQQPENEEVHNQPVRQSMMLDMDGNALAIGKNKNLTLGRIRSAVGQNVEGEPWFPNMLIGQTAIIKVEHRSYERKDGTSGVSAEVSMVTKLPY